MKLWEIVEACARGGYIAGDAFVNEFGQKIYFDGQRLIGIESVDLKSNWDYAGIENVAS